MQIAVGSEGLWQRFCAEFGLDPAREGMATNGERAGDRQAVIAVVEEVFAPLGVERASARLARAGIPFGQVRTLDQVYADPQTASQGLLVDVEHATLGRLTLPGPPLRFFDPADGAETTPTEHRAPPVLGGDGEDVRAWLARRKAGGTA